MLFASAGGESSASTSPPTPQGSIISNAAWEDQTAPLSPDTSMSPCTSTPHEVAPLSLPTELEYRLYELSQANVVSRPASEASSSGNPSTPGCTNFALNPHTNYSATGISVELATGDSFWTAVVERDPRAVNVFWYGVTSTKICKCLCDLVVTVSTSS
jgi:hypothetical protein